MKKSTNTSKPAISGIILIDYSEKAIAVFGDSKPYKDELKEYGRFNRFLSYKGEKMPGWIFSKKHRQEVQAIVKSKLPVANKAQDKPKAKKAA